VTAASHVIPTVPDKGRVNAVAIGGKDKDTLYAFCGNKIWKRKIQQHALGGWFPWTKVVPTKLKLQLAMQAWSQLIHPLSSQRNQ
jgi:hypothetical protein